MAGDGATNILLGTNKTPVKRVSIYDDSGNLITGSNPFPVTSSGSNALNNYNANDVDEDAPGDISYVGMESSDAKWIVMEIDDTTGKTIRYANTSNNVGTSDYVTAWTNRASLTYDYWSVITDA